MSEKHMVCTVCPMGCRLTVTCDESGELVSVRTKTPVSKTSIPQVLEALKGFRAQAPVAVGQVLIANVAGTGADLVATRRIRKV